jgi:hypothetical protein
MTDREQYPPGPASGAQFRWFWSAHVDALERHLDFMDQDGMDHDAIDHEQYGLSRPAKRNAKERTARPKPRR